MSHEASGWLGDSPRGRLAGKQPGPGVSFHFPKGMAIPEASFLSCPGSAPSGLPGGCPRAEVGERGTCGLHNPASSLDHP